MPVASPLDALRVHLAYEPVALKFGTSGRRGLVIHLTQLEIYTNVLAEIRYLQSIAPSEGGIAIGDDFYFAHDLRPSSTEYVENGRGGLCQAVQQAIKDGGMRPVNLGAIPTPALTFFALEKGKGSIMVTGSHIPFDRNGYKLNTSKGELLKEHEQPIGEAVSVTRGQLLAQPYAESVFDSQGMLRGVDATLVAPVANGKTAYLQRYLDFFSGQTLQGMKLLIYQHSAVGRDLLVELLEKMGAEVVAVGRSQQFIPIDTEAIDQAQFDTVQALYDESGQSFHAVISTDGDSDRPLLLAPENGKLRFFSGDLLGMVVAEFLRPDAVVVPISTNDGIDRGSLAGVLEKKTKIGSPYVIAGMQQAIDRGCRRVVGWEANGGFLTGSDIDIDGKVLTALPTRDAVLPLLCALFATHRSQSTVATLFETLPKRFSRSGLIRNFPRPISAKIVERLSPPAASMQEVYYQSGLEDIIVRDAQDGPVTISAIHTERLVRIRRELEAIFSAQLGFAPITRFNYTDGVRIGFENGDVAHLRPSGNADELRIYSVADRQDRAEEIVKLGVAEPDGLLRRLASFAKL
ncbi:hypothetical protein MW887_005697 [Aspergillus wentii]|nr:hypothetical protein MW887_005697 [Aspergillus wentii]